MAKADATSRDGPAAPLGVQPDGQLPLPWLAAGLAGARQLAGAHALLIHGPAGAGHFDMAVLLAQTLLCESVPAGTAAARACGHCASCHLVATRAHPDLRLVLPAALRVQRGWTDEDDYIAPKGDAKPSRELRIDQVRAAIDWAQQTSGRGRAKVLLLHPADALNLSAANALLKTLEEPPGQMRVLLTSADPEHLLPTVRSRCQHMSLAAPDVAIGAAWLAGQGVKSPELLLAACSGRPLDALSLSRAGIDADTWAALPQAVARGRAAALAGWPLPLAVDALHKICHDAMARATGAPTRFFPAQSVPVARLAALSAWQQELARVARHDEHPWNEGLLIDALVTAGASALANVPTARAGGARRLDTLSPT